MVLIEHYPKTTKLYDLPKIHELNIPLRPILSGINVPLIDLINL